MTTLPPHPPVAPVPGPPRTPPGWYPDPYRQAPARYWDGSGWTAHLAWPRPPRWWAGPPPSLDWRAAPAMVGVIVAVLLFGPILPALAVDVIGSIPATLIAYVMLYGAIAAGAVLIVRRFGTGDLRRDLGWSARGSDVSLLVLGGIGLWLVQIVLSIILQFGDVPTRSNTEDLDQVQQRPGAFLVLLLGALVFAPIVEEVAYRGVIQRSLASRLPAPAAIAVTGFLFGLSHVIPTLGWGNLGLVIILWAIGCLLGALAHLTGRLGPAIWAHAGLNGLVMAIVWFVAPEFV